MIHDYHITHFLISVPAVYCLPNEKIGMEVAFVGYSNSGKSSAINALTYQKKLTKVSKTPGCTQLINLFEVSPGIRLIDFPGYGYAKKTKKRKNYWHDVICEYLKKRKNLKGLILMMDIRHPIKDLDQKTIESALSVDVPVFTLLSKSDKISRNILQVTSKKIIHDMKMMFETHIQVEPFSVVKKYGIHSLKRVLNNWLR
ncbi:Probable GTP-binding protein [Candidatus Blochmanniella pennsylvanica str. BPEN]|uniref:Probable GTP-binding protein EngB n=2 Tax=Candidatus Blochmanniella TaxID=203804 RepID=ENGB_BLOPB|nr:MULTISPECIES: ribosome biogenesis GTP-binding protein YihA/YsxC [Blochmannia]Q491W2.1 RecName: Full=Probable GTP-binding protein EngB [Candidatus Blochmannia pennsylvanicus str. BPEN]AAZ41242.1 Probable GTP-binding protein [Candidatus Blochmannia pennsylvanicus str. BPEN]AGC03887.1 putative GTP-binding protein EngB [Candidatus Blochmannia chromaiodes str. 640]UOY04428.1 ribosome biogenesis GTP-binding protein YihA/YsxC [Candidatus Blochmannia pennsylvanicus]